MTEIQKIQTDCTLRELRSHGSEELPFAYYFDEFSLFDLHCIAWHWHREFEVVRVDAGPVDCRIGTETLRIAPGCGAFINSGVLHRFDSTDAGRMPNIVFSPEWIAPEGSAVYQRCVLPVLRSGCAYLLLDGSAAWHREALQLLEQIFSCAREEKEPYPLTALSATCAFWTALFSGAHWQSAPASPGQTQARLHAMLQFIRENYARRISIQDIAFSAHISKSEALRCFRAGVQTSPGQYLLDFRLRRARELLALPGRNVTEAAAQAGFENVSYFIRQFSRAFGMTPKAYQLSLQGRKTSRSAPF